MISRACQGKSNEKASGKGKGGRGEVDLAGLTGLTCTEVTLEVTVIDWVESDNGSVQPAR